VEAKWLVPAICAGLVLLVFIVFGQTVTHEFITTDDDDYVYKNPVVIAGLTWKGVVWAFGFHAYNWHPLTWISHMADCQIYGLNPSGHHLSNVILHAATAVGVFLLLRSLTGALWPAALAAAIFAVHPLRVESVAWVAERKDVLSGFFFILTIAAYARYARRPFKAGRYGLVVVVFALALMCKPMLVTAPLIMLLLDFWPLQRAKPWPALLLEKVPFLAMVGACCVLTILAQRDAIHAGPSFAISLRLSNALISYVVYLRQLFWPSNLIFFYGYPHAGIPVAETVACALLLCGVTLFGIWQRRRWPWILAGWLWYLVMLLPVIGIIQVGDQAHADRYTYLPQIGLLVAVVWTLAALKLPQVVSAAMSVLLLAALAIGSFELTTIWKTGQSLWSRAISCAEKAGASPEALAVLHYGRGVADAAAGDQDAAVADYRICTEENPHFSAALVNWGDLLRIAGDMNGAIDKWEQAVRGDPEAGSAYNDLGNAYLSQWNYPKAEENFEKAVRCKANDPWVKNNFAWVLSTAPDPSLRDGKKALGLARQAQALSDGNYPIIHRTLAAALAETGQFDGAAGEAEKALKLAETQGNSTMAQNFQLQLETYKAGKPFHFQPPAR
jgi:Flp pilus assembly protein TadD